MVRSTLLFFDILGGPTGIREENSNYLWKCKVFDSNARIWTLFGELGSIPIVLWWKKLILKPVRLRKSFQDRLSPERFVFWSWDKAENTLLKGKEAPRVFSACPEPQNDIDSHNSCHRSEENELMQTFTAGQDQTWQESASHLTLLFGFKSKCYKWDWYMKSVEKGREKAEL